MHTRYYPAPANLAGITLGQHAVLEASAGTGKTYTIERLVVYLLLHTGCAIDELLVVTFTEKATAELRGRIRGTLESILLESTNEPPEGPHWEITPDREARIRKALAAFDGASIFTIHGFCQRLLAEFAFSSGQPFQQELIDGKTAFSRAFRHVLRQAIDPVRNPLTGLLMRAYLLDGSADALEDLVWQVCRERSPCVPSWDPQAWTEALERAEPSQAGELLAVRGLCVESALAQELAGAVQARLDREKQLQGWLDFDDMLLRVRDRLRGEGGAEWVAALRAKYRFALIDEFQDTDGVQWEIFRKVFYESGGQNPLFIVGDPKQAIYSFRGADVHTYIEAKKTLLAGGASEIPIHENFRSTGELIRAYNALLKTRPPGWSGADPFFEGGIDYRREVTRGKPPLRVCRANEDVHANRPVHVLHYTPTAERKVNKAELQTAFGKMIAQEIGDLLNPNKPPLQIIDHLGRTKDLRARDIFVLTRTNGEADAVGAYLREAGVPFAFYKQEGLFQTAEAQDVCDALAAVLDPAVASNRLRAWATPFFAVPWGALASTRDLAGDHPLMSTLFEWNKLADDQSYAELFERMLHGSGLLRRELLTRDGEREITNYCHIFETLLETATKRRCSLPELLRLLENWISNQASPEGEDGNVQRLETDQEAVQIMTIHKSKGLQAGVVFLFGGFTSGRSPSQLVWRFHDDAQERKIYIGRLNDETRENPLIANVDARVKDEQRWEYQRLYYVAITRAIARLYLPLLGGEPKETGCAYDCVNLRLAALRQEGGERWSTNFHYRPFDEALPHSRSAIAQTDLKDWSPGSYDEHADKPDWEALRWNHRPLRSESFTSLRKPARHQSGLDGRGDEEGPGAPVATAPDELAPGANTGIFLHEALESVDFTTLEGTADSASWLAGAPSQKVLLDSLARQYAIPERHVEHANRLIHAALNTPLAPEAGPALPPVAKLDRVLREADFLYPIPEAHHPSITEWNGEVEVREGYLKGFIDLLFEHGGRIYFLDWKSNVLADYRPAALEVYVEEEYALQGLLYSLAVAKMFGFSPAEYEKKFGGFFYVFLRGLTPGGQGIYYHKHSWDDLAQFAGRLMRHEQPLAKGAFR